MSSSSDSSVEYLDYQALGKLTMADELQRMLDYKPPRIKPHSTPLPITSPLSFYDKHIDQSLSLKHVHVLPSLLSGVPDTVSAAFDSMKQQGIQPIFEAFARTTNRQTDRALWFRSVSDAETLANILRRTSVDYCRALAMTVFISPRYSKWAPMLIFGQSYRAREAWVPDTFKSCLEIDSRFLDDCMDKSLKESLSEVSERFPEVAIWMINTVSDEAESLSRRMDDVASSKSFNWLICLTKGHTRQPFVGKQIFDGRKAPWSLPIRSTRRVPIFYEGPWKYTRARNVDSNPPTRANRNTRSAAADNRPKVVHVMYPPSVQQANKRQEEVAGSATSEQLLQHAWAEAVRQDTTVIVFSCGNFERIGIRHRGTQTLYLSQLIKTYRCKDPPYGKLHTGLYVAALEDAIDRAAQQAAAEASNRSPLDIKPASAVEGPAHRTRKRIKIHTSRPVGEKSDHTIAILKEARSRQLALIYLRYDVYNSPAPASFLRHGSSQNQRSFRANEYINVIFDSYLGFGATGILHGGKMELETADGQHLVYNVAVKLAFNEEQRTRLKREYDIYAYMEAANVIGIMDIIGLFQDMEGQALALVMSHGGISLCDRELRTSVRPTGRRLIPIASSQERSAFLRALKSIHNAGIRHRDLRPPNLVVNEDTGEVAIIDFDRAHRGLSDDEACYEMNHLKNVLDGKWFDEELSPSTEFHRYARGGSYETSSSDSKTELST